VPGQSPGCRSEPRSSSQGRPVHPGVSTGAIVATCKFNTDAVVVAAEAGKPPVELVDADRLTDLALEYRVGVRSESVEAFTENLDAVFSEVEGS